MRISGVTWSNTVGATKKPLAYSSPRNGLLGDACADLIRPGETDRLDLGVLDQFLARLGAAPDDEIQHAGGQSRFFEHLYEVPRGERRELSGFEHHGVAIGEGRCDFP